MTHVADWATAFKLLEAEMTLSVSQESHSEDATTINGAPAPDLLSTFDSEAPLNVQEAFLARSRKSFKAALDKTWIDGRGLMTDLRPNSDINALLNNPDATENCEGSSLPCFFVRERPDANRTVERGRLGAYALSAELDVKEHYLGFDEVVERLTRFCNHCRVPFPSHIVIGEDMYLSVYWCVDRYLEPEESDFLTKPLFDFLFKAGLITHDTALTWQIDLRGPHRVPVVVGQEARAHQPKVVWSTLPLSVDALAESLRKYYAKCWPKACPNEGRTRT